MSTHYKPRIITDNLIYYVDGANTSSYPGTGTICDDLSRRQLLELSLVNGVAFENNNGGVFTFDGVDDLMLSDVTMNGKMTSGMTFDVWFKRTQDMNAFNMVVSNPVPYIAFRGSGAGVNSQYFLFSFITRISSTNTQRFLYSNNTFSDNVWYNVVCTLSQNTTTQVVEAKMYVNGELNNTISASSATDSVYQPTDGTFFRLANYAPMAYPFKGNISSVKMYDKLLTSDEILQNYNTLKNRFN